MTPVQRRGLSRLMLRMPARRVELREAKGLDFLDLCEAYDLACDAIAYWSRRAPADRVEDYRTLASNLEDEALLLALGVPTEHVRRRGATSGELALAQPPEHGP